MPDNLVLNHSHKQNDYGHDAKKHSHVAHQHSHGVIDPTITTNEKGIWAIK